MFSLQIGTLFSETENESDVTNNCESSKKLGVLFDTAALFYFFIIIFILLKIIFKIKTYLCKFHFTLYVWKLFVNFNWFFEDSNGRVFVPEIPLIPLASQNFAIMYANMQGNLFAETDTYFLRLSLAVWFVLLVIYMLCFDFLIVRIEKLA